MCSFFPWPEFVVSFVWYLTLSWRCRKALRKNGDQQLSVIIETSTNCLSSFLQLTTLLIKTRVLKNQQQAHCVNLNNFALQQKVINGYRIFYETLTLRVGAVHKIRRWMALARSRRMLNTQTASQRKKKDKRTRIRKLSKISDNVIHCLIV